MLASVARIAIIGGGSIGEALLSGLLRSGRQAKDMVIAERHPDRAKYLSDTYSVLVTTVADAAESAAFVVVAVKPSDVEKVIGDISEAAAEQLKEVSAIFDEVGGVLTVPESHHDADTALSGSGPAYFFLMVEALVDAGVGVGLPRAVATDLAVQTMAGSAAMLLESLDNANPSGDGAMGTAMDTSAAQLRATVTSPGGTTAAGLRELERGGRRAAVAEAVVAAKTRSEQLGITSE